MKSPETWPGGHYLAVERGLMADEADTQSDSLPVANCQQEGLDSPPAPPRFPLVEIARFHPSCERFIPRHGDAA